MQQHSAYSSTTLKRISLWIMIIFSLVGIPTGLAYYSVYRYVSILEHDNLYNYKKEKQHIIGIAEQAVDQNMYMSRHFLTELKELSKQDLKYEEILDWIKKEQIRLNYDFEFAAQRIVTKDTFAEIETSSNFNIGKRFLPALFSELIQVAPSFNFGDVNRYNSVITTDLKLIKQFFGNQLVLESFADLAFHKDTSILWGDSARKKPPFAAYILPRCIMLFVFKPEAIYGNSILKLTIKELCEKNPKMNIALKDLQNLDEGLWFSNPKEKVEIDSELFDTFENSESNLQERDEDYISYQILSQRFRLAIIGKKIYSKKQIHTYSFIGALIYLMFMLPFLTYTYRTIVKELPGKASIRLKLVFLLWFATGIPLISMTVISQEHYQNKRQIQMENIQKLTKETIQNYDRRYRSYTKNLSFILNKYFEKWVKDVRKDGFTPEKHRQTQTELLKLIHTDNIYIIATGPVIANYCGYIVYDGDLEHPRINYGKSKLTRAVNTAIREEYTLLNLLIKKIMADLNHESLSSLLVTKLEFIAETMLQANFAEITNELMTKIRDIQLWGFYAKFTQTYFDFLSVYKKDKYDYAVTCFWFADDLQKIFLNDSLLEINRNPSGIKLMAYHLKKNNFYSNMLSVPNVVQEYFAYKVNELKEPVQKLDYIKIRDEEYALINLTLLKKENIDADEYEKSLNLTSEKDQKNVSLPMITYCYPGNYKIKIVSITNKDPKRIFSANMYPNIINDKEKVLDKYIENIGNTEAKEIEILNIGGKQYAVFSANGQYLYCYKLITLYPLNFLEQNINVEKTDLLMYIIFSLVLAISVAQLLVRSFVLPLNTLREGAIAIEEKNFDHRIEEISKDEFGEVSTIFNKMMVGLSEVETAKIVQESLFPKENFSHNNFTIYGKSVAMSGVGGDYFDYFVSDENNFSALVGDVAGHGIGAALIMAMAKSGILCNKEQQSSPKKILGLLHNLILKAKSAHQRKIMTFQYIYCNSITGECMYANAGACSPFIYRKATGTVEELKLLAPVLGGFKKTIFNEIPVNFEPGDAIVFYTDGMVESRNAKGIEIGYTGLKTIIKTSYNPNPAIYYQNLYRTYLKHIEGVDVQDDITIVIAIFQPPQENCA